MSYIIFSYLRALLETEEQSEDQLKQSKGSDTTMGNNSSVTSLTGIHGPSVGIAVGVSVGILLCLAAIQYYQNRQLKKRLRQLVSVTPEMQMYVKPSSKNPFAYRNLGYFDQGHNVANNQARPQMPQMPAGGLPAGAV